MTVGFFDFFPVPQKMRPPRAGIDISDDAVRIVVLGQHRGGDVVQAYVCKPLPPGAVVSGYIDHADEVVATLQAAVHEAGCTDAYVTLPEEKMYVFSLDGMSEDTDVRTAVETHLEDHVPIPPAESVFEVVPVPVSTKKAALVTVFPRKTVEAYWNVCTRAGIAVWGFESFPQSLARAVTAPISAVAPSVGPLRVRSVNKVMGPTDGTGAYTQGATAAQSHEINTSPRAALLVHIFENKTGIYVVVDGLVRFTSTLSFGRGATLEAIKKEMKVSTEEANRLFGMSLLDPKIGKEVFEAALTTISAIKDEAHKVFTYWQTHAQGEESIEISILSGSGVLMNGLDGYLSSVAQIPFTLANPWRNVALAGGGVPDIPRPEALIAAPAIGAALVSSDTII